MSDNTSVRVAVRVRPLVRSELDKGCRDIIEVIDENEQIVIKSIEKDRAYTFNYVLSSQSKQEELYRRCVEPLIGNLFRGYNVTILAYGQTGSGKTHSMGTTYAGEGEMGVIPRTVTDIFKFVNDNFSFHFTITVSFMELYQEILYDLLSEKPREQCMLEIREDTSKGIHIPNLTEIEVKSVQDVLRALERGTAGRATSATAMNAQSSRSHAIFTVSIAMNNRENCTENKQAKLHLVDLAGSERPKKTQATGNTFKEGVNINKGLLALGNVISFLGDEKTQHGFIPYRDSNLTRLLKDSLGGNSITLMIACVSPADYNLEETVSTLRYADRAKKIKNKPVINQDPKAAEINALKKNIQQLRLQILGQGGTVAAPGEIESLRKELEEVKSKKRDLSTQLSAALINNMTLHEKIIILQNSNDVLNSKFAELKDRFDVTLNNFTIGVETNNNELLKENLCCLQEIKNQFIEIDLDQKKTEEEISAHDEDKFISKESPDSGRQEMDDIEERQESHADRQLKLNVELTEVERQLNVKQILAKQLINQFVVDPQALAENETKITTLEREKEELVQMLKNVGNSGKISEQRRKRVQELEQQIADLKKKVQTQNNVIKLKAKAEERIKVLNQEITQMKQLKVKLVKTMREESDRFRQWKLEKERECIRLKKQDIKKEHEINRMKSMHHKQQNVFKRRVEEAEAINKRLKQALALKQQAQEARTSGKAERLEPWLKQEFDLYVNIVEAEATLKVLLEDRATLQAQLDEMKKGGSGDAECKSIEDDLELRSVQIQDLQQKLLDSDEESRSKTRFDKFQTMAEAKYGIKFLFNRTSEVVREKVSYQMKLSELQENYNETIEKLSAKEELSKKIEELEMEKKELRARLECVVAMSTQAAKTPQVLKETVSVDCEAMSSQEVRTPKALRETFYVNREDGPVKLPDIKVTSIKQTESRDDSLDESVIDVDDIENDPDWRKTPLGKRIMEEKRKITVGRNTVLNFEDDDKPVKRCSDGGCTCKTNCKSARCGCRKLGQTCGNMCKCKQSVCENRDSLDPASPVDSDEFKKPSCIDPPRKKLKKSRNLFNL